MDSLTLSRCLALMYFHRANRIKPGQTICLEGIDKSTEILQCTICNSNLHLTMTKNFIDTQDKSTEHISLLNRPPIRKPIPPVEQVLTKYTNEDANRLLNEVGKDRQVLIDLVMDEQSSAGWSELFLFLFVESFLSLIRFYRFKSCSTCSSSKYIYS